MSQPVGGDSAGPGKVRPGRSAGTVSLPGRPVTPLAAVSKRMLLAAMLLAASTVIVYLGRSGYRDAAHPGQPLSALASLYYATVTLSTTGFGDVVPVAGGGSHGHRGVRDQGPERDQDAG
jgi:hypothetical protein